MDKANSDDSRAALLALIARSLEEGLKPYVFSPPHRLTRRACNWGEREGNPHCDAPATYVLRHEEDCPWNETDELMGFCDQHSDAMMDVWKSNPACTVVKERLPNSQPSA